MPSAAWRDVTSMPSYWSKGKNGPALASAGDVECGSGLTSIAPDLAFFSLRWIRIGRWFQKWRPRARNTL